MRSERAPPEVHEIGTSWPTGATALRQWSRPRLTAAGQSEAGGAVCYSDRGQCSDVTVVLYHARSSFFVLPSCPHPGFNSRLSPSISPQGIARVVPSTHLGFMSK